MKVCLLAEIRTSGNLFYDFTPQITLYRIFGKFDKMNIFIALPHIGINTNIVKYIKVYKSIPATNDESLLII
jgi:hypothetical protein